MPETDRLKEVAEWVEHYRRFWEESFVRIDDYLRELGGAMLIHMRAPDGVTYPMTGIFQEIVPPERLSFTSSALDAGGKPLFEILTTVTFADEGSKTELTVRAKVTSATPGAAPHLGVMEQGWSQSLDRLAQEVSA
jgi:uncharacterized protein YndB with AHSA1/START domain